MLPFPSPTSMDNPTTPHRLLSATITKTFMFSGRASILKLLPTTRAATIPYGNRTSLRSSSPLLTAIPFNTLNLKSVPRANFSLPISPMPMETVLLWVISSSSVQQLIMEPPWLQTDGMPGSRSDWTLLDEERPRQSSWLTSSEWTTQPTSPSDIWLGSLLMPIPHAFTSRLISRKSSLFDPDTPLESCISSDISTFVLLLTSLNH